MPYEKEIIIEAKAGSILILNSLFGIGGANLTGDKRGIIVTEYRQRALKQLLNLKKYVSQDMKKKICWIERKVFVRIER